MSKVDDGLRPMIRRNINAHWCTVETGQTEGGVPDLNGCLPRSSDRPGMEFWIECKATETFSVRFRPLQVGWLMTRVRYGGRAFVAVRRHGVRVRTGEYDELYMFDGAYAGLLSQHGIQGTPYIGFWEGGEAKFDWRRFVWLLMSHQMDHRVAEDMPEPRKGL